jgi:hypothetical protein
MRDSIRFSEESKIERRLFPAIFNSNHGLTKRITHEIGRSLPKVLVHISTQNVNSFDRGFNFYP